MNKTIKARISYFKKPTRVMAVFLTLILLSSVFTSSALTRLVTIKPSDVPGEAAVNYLFNNTDFINGNSFQRLSSVLGTLGEQHTLHEYYSLASTYIAREQYDMALITVDKCIELFNDEGEELLLDLWLKKGCLHVMLNEYAEAITALDEVLEINASIPDAYLVKAQVYASLELYQDMCENLERYLFFAPDDEAVALLLTQTREELAKSTETVNLPSDQSNLPQPTVDNEYLKGLYAMQDGDYELAEAALSKAILDSDYEGVYYYRGVCRLSLEDYGGAVADFTVSISKDAMVYSSYYNRGISLIMTDEYEKGLADINYAYEFSEDPVVKGKAESFLIQLEVAQNEAQLAQYLTAAQVKADLGDLDGVCENLEKYLAQVPDDISIRNTLANTRFALEDYKEALEQYAIILKSKQSAETEYLYGITALQLSDFTLAEKALNKSISIEDSCKDVYYYRGVCRLSLENYKAAADDFTISIRLGDKVHSSLFNRGVSYLMLEKNDLGIKDIKVAAEMDEDAEIKQRAKQLLSEFRQNN